MSNTTFQLDAVQVTPFSSEGTSTIDLLAKRGAEQILALALEAEVNEYLQRFRNVVDENGHQMVVRNGYSKPRQILSGAGLLQVQQPRVNDRRPGKQFTSAILPPYMRKSPTIEKLIPCLYLRGVSTNQFQGALEAILGANCPGLSSSAISEMMKKWQTEFDAWNKRDLSGKKYVYFWADGVHLKVRLGDQQKASLLVIMGATEDGRKEPVGIYSGYRESTESWLDLLRGLRDRGLAEGPKLAVGDGALGFWNAISEVYPETEHQRCWVHKTANILDKMPKCVQEQAKQAIHNIYLADTEDNALQAYNDFISKYEAKYPKAVDCLQKSREQLFSFYDFPAMHWTHIRTTNVIESTFATVRHRTRQTKGSGSRKAAEAMAYKLLMEGAKHWKKLKGAKLILKIYDENIVFKDGEELIPDQQKVG